MKYGKLRSIIQCSYLETQPMLLYNLQCRMHYVMKILRRKGLLISVCSCVRFHTNWESLFLDSKQMRANKNDVWITHSASYGVLEHAPSPFGPGACPLTLWSWSMPPHPLVLEHAPSPFGPGACPLTPLPPRIFFWKNITTSSSILVGPAP